MPLLTGYAYHDSPIHRLDPRTKLLWLGVMLVIVYSTSNLAILLGCLLLISLMSSLGRLDLRAFLPLVKALLLLAVFLLIIQTLFQTSGSVFLQVGPVNFYQKGLWITAQVLMRVLSMALLFLQFLMWTHPVDLTLMFVQFRLPYKYAMVLPLALRFFPILEKELASIFEAQQARGLELKSVFQKVPRLAFILLPFCLRAMRRANDIALSMELKGFGYRSERTFLRDIKFSPTDAVMSTLMGGLLVAWVVVRVITPAALA